MTDNPSRIESRQRLGRGLAALLGDSQRDESQSESVQGVRKIPVEFLRSNPKNPRRLFSDQELDDLAASIRERGIIQPIVVRPFAGLRDAYEIVAGERRWRAAQKAGLHSVPVIVVELGDRDALELAIVENVQRADLSALEEAGGYSRLASEYGYSQADIARVVGKSRSHIANTLRLLALSDHVRNLLDAGSISAGHARALLTVADPDAVADRIVTRGLTVRDIERLARNEVAPTSKRKKGSVGEQEPDVQAVQNQLSLSLGAEVNIRNFGSEYEVRIRLKHLDQLSYVCERLRTN